MKQFRIGICPFGPLINLHSNNHHLAAIAEAAILDFRFFEHLLILKHFVENSQKIMFCRPKLNFLIIFIQKIESLTANSILHNFYDDVINVDIIYEV